MYKHKLFLLPLALLLAFIALACAPPDDDAPSSGPSGPTINNAIYDVGKALLTVQGTDLSPTSVKQAQIQTIRVGSRTNGVAFSAYTADAKPTGVNSNGLEQGKYRMKSDGTALWLRLTDADKATLNGKVGSNGLKKGLLSVSSGSWAGLDTAKDLTVRNVPGKQSPKQAKVEQDEQAEQAKQVEQAAITRASYHVGTALLTLQGTDLASATQAQIQTIKVYDLVLSSYIADGTATGPDSRGLAKGKYRMKSDGTALWLKLTDRHKATLQAKPGMANDGLKKGLLSVGTGSWAGLDTAKALTVSGNPAITGASYHVGTALLTVQGTHLASAQQAQIQTIKVYDLILSSYIADGTATGPDSRGLAKGKYRMKNDGTALWLYLTDRHKATLNGKPGMANDGLKKGKLSVGTGAWAGLDTAKALTVSGNPAITRASYNVGTALLTVQGSNLSPTTATQAQIQTITVYDLALSSYTADTTATGADSRSLAKGKYRMKRDGTALWLYLTDTDKAILNGKDGMNTNGRKDGLLSVGTGSWVGLDTAKALAVSGNPAPAITRATYSGVTGVLVITGVNLPSTVHRWDFRKLRLVSGDGSKRYQLPKHSGGVNAATGFNVSAIKLSIELRGSAKVEADKIFVNDGDSDANGKYNLEAAAGFAGGSAEDTTNPITVSGYTASIINATYDANTGQLVIQGKNLPKTVAGWDFRKLTLVSGDGRKRYTLPRHATAGENTATGSNVSAIYLYITLSGSIKAEAEKILVNDGVRDDNGAYNLEAAAEFVPGSAGDTSNPITVSGYTSQIDRVLYIAYRGRLEIIGNRLPTAVADWDFSKLTLVSGDGKKRYQLPQHSTVGADKATGSKADATFLRITLSGSVKAEVEKILVKAGKSDNNGAYNFEAAAEFVPGSAEDLTTSIQVF